MRETQKCEKCGRVFSQITQNGSSPLTELSAITRRASSKECPYCGGKVAWVQSEYDEMKGFGVHQKDVCCICGKLKKETRFGFGWRTCENCGATYCLNCRANLELVIGGLGKRECRICHGTVP